MTTSRLPVTISIIAVCVAVYLIEGALLRPNEALSLGALVPAFVAQGEVWRLLSSIFLHAGLTHLALNMVSLYFLGSFAEVQFGWGRFLALYFVSGLAGGLAYLYFGDFGAPAVGASGAIFGLVGGVFGFAMRRGTFSMQNPIIGQLLLLTAVNLFIGFSIPNISNTAHIGGLVGGIVYGWLFAPTVYSQKKLTAAAPFAAAFGIEAVLLAAWLIFLA